MTKGQVIFGVGSALVVTGVVYFGFIKKMSNGLTWYQGLTGGKGDNFGDLKKNLGDRISDKGTVVTVPFNSNKNQADFYNNGRVIIAKAGATGYLVKGSYSDGGKTIVLDGGKTITSGSVWGNLLETIK